MKKKPFILLDSSSLILPVVFTNFKSFFSDAAVERLPGRHFLRAHIASSGDCFPDHSLFLHCSFLFGFLQEAKKKRKVRFSRFQLWHSQLIYLFSCCCYVCTVGVFRWTLFSLITFGWSLVPHIRCKCRLLLAVGI